MATGKRTGDGRRITETKKVPGENLPQWVQDSDPRNWGVRVTWPAGLRGGQQRGKKTIRGATWIKFFTKKEKMGGPRHVPGPRHYPSVKKRESYP